MKNILLKTAVISTLFSSILIGCKKEDAATPTTPAATTQDLSLKMTSMVGSSALNFYSSFSTTSGQRYTLSMFRYYVSNIRLVKSDGSEYPITGKCLLVTPSTENYDLGQVPIGDYRGLKFNIGLDSLTNHSDPTLYPTTNPLAIQSPGIHWDWNSGYIFMMIEGSCDTTTTNTDVLTYGQYSHGMFFHIGMDMLLRTVDLSTSAFSVSSGSAKVVNIQADVNKFFTNIDLKTQNESHTMGSMSLATTGADNIPTMFSVIP